VKDKYYLALIFQLNVVTFTRFELILIKVLPIKLKDFNRLHHLQLTHSSQIEECAGGIKSVIRG